jgi:hypothetical protein
LEGKTLEIKAEVEERHKKRVLKLLSNIENDTVFKKRENRKMKM